MSAAVLEAHGLGKTFRAGFPRRDTFTALHDVSFELRPGEVLAFLGPNGAGKTTTINLLLAFLQPTRGSARLFGLPPTDRRARERLGFLPEHFAFYPFLTAPTLLHYFGRLHGIPAGERARRVDDLIARTGLEDARGRAVGRYSRGMRQRLGIAQALLAQPELLILDEPTSGFDPIGRRMVRDLLVELKAGGTSVFLCSHILSEVETVCDRVLIIDRGRVVRQGTLEEVLGGGDGVEVRFRDADGTVDAALRAQGFEPARNDEGPFVAVDTEDAAQRAIDAIRAAGGAITGYHARTRTLEDAFIEHVVGRTEKPREGGTR